MPVLRPAPVGIGDTNFCIAFYIESRPRLEPYHSMCDVITIKTGDIQYISESCGNGWRKVFNVYAKLLFSLPETKYEFKRLAPSWQILRDQYLCQQGSKSALFFTPPALREQLQGEPQPIHIIAGRTYAKKLLQQGLIDVDLLWLDNDFAVDLTQRLIISPYLDYRQLSNIKIDKLIRIIDSVLKGKLERVDLC